MSEQQHTTPEIDAGYPTNTVIGVIDDPRATRAVVTELTEMPIDPGSIDVICNEVAEEKLEQFREQHPWKARILRFLRLASNNAAMWEGYERWLRDGRYLVRVPAENAEQAEAVGKVMERHGGHFINFLGQFMVTTLAP